jgi:hypothetical protein
MDTGLSLIHFTLYGLLEGVFSPGTNPDDWQFDSMKSNNDGNQISRTPRVFPGRRSDTDLIFSFLISSAKCDLVSPDHGQFPLLGRRIHR